MAKRIRVTPKAGAVAPPYAKSYDAEVPVSLEYPRVPLHAFLDDAAESYPGSTATIFFNAKRSYASLLRDAKRFSAGLRALGVKKGDRVAIDLNKGHLDRDGGKQELELVQEQLIEIVRSLKGHAGVEDEADETGSV